MSKTIFLRKVLQSKLTAITTNVYYEIAADNATHPYVVYELSELTYTHGKTLFQLEINVLDYGNGSINAEVLADNIQFALNEMHYIDGVLQMTIYQGARQTVRESDKEVIRKRLLFEIQLHEMKGE